MLPPSRTLKYKILLGGIARSRKSNTDPAEKIKVVERVLADEIGILEAAKLTGVDKATIQRWRNLYLSDGPTALMDQPGNKVYSQELKLQAIQDYLDGGCSQADIVKNTIYEVPASCTTG